ncbi:DnaB-like helicase N-terminal domain-containing protein [Streptomyces sp. enrichment culture]|uniref:DnaB-like helicase N-terminal domain-containing protein n=1 Tax=Streptomyces sp. enrichment culture TaxID=1795815 RepID=UPI003F559C53
MGRWTRPTLPEGPLRTLNRELHALHRKAGHPSARELQRAVGKAVSHTKIHHAFIKPQLPAWGVVEVVVEQLATSARPKLLVEAEVDRFKALWDAASDAASSAAATPTDEHLHAVVLGGLSRNGAIFSAIVDLHQAGKPTGPHYVAAELARRGQLEACGGEEYLFECVKVAMKGAFEAGMSIGEFGVLNAHRVKAASDARHAFFSAALSGRPDRQTLEAAYDRVIAFHPDWAWPGGFKAAPPS